MDVGDVVERTRGSYAGMRVGDTGVIVEMNEFGQPRIQGYESAGSIWHDRDNLKVIKGITSWKKVIE